jgi:hypothetical protein
VTRSCSRRTPAAGASLCSVGRSGLQLVEVESAGINHPISVTISNGIVYVLNGGASNCLGGAPTITGFRLDATGTLTPIPGSTRPVSGGALSGCTQVSFAPGGNVLVATEKNVDVISTYTVGSDGIATGPITNRRPATAPSASRSRCPASCSPARTSRAPPFRARRRRTTSGVTAS